MVQALNCFQHICINICLSDSIKGRNFLKIPYFGFLSIILLTNNCQTYYSDLFANNKMTAFARKNIDHKEIIMQEIIHKHQLSI